MILLYLLNLQGVFDVDHHNGLTLKEIADNHTIDEIWAATGCDFKVRQRVKER